MLGANDGIVSTASLVVGVAAAEATPHAVLVAGVAGLVAGALSMAAGEYVSVSSQADTEQADLKREKEELATDPKAEEEELAGIYRRRGLELELARTVARRLMTQSPLVSLLCLVALGAIAARIGGAPMLVGATRITVWGALAMAATAAVGKLFGATVG